MVQAGRTLSTATLLSPQLVLPRSKGRSTSSASAAIGNGEVDQRRGGELEGKGGGREELGGGT